MIPDFPHTVGNETPHWGESFPTPWGGGFQDALMTDSG